MAELKTKQTNASVISFLDTVKEEQRRKDAKALLKLFKEATDMPAKMWGTSIVGFGSYHYKSERSHQEGDMLLVGFSPRSQSLVLYLPGFKGYELLLKKLGPHTTSVGCLYLKRLSDVHLPTLRTLIQRSVKDMRKKYG